MTNTMIRRNTGSSNREFDWIQSRDAAALTVHRFLPAPLEVGSFAQDLTERVREQVKRWQS